MVSAWLGGCLKIPPIVAVCEIQGTGLTSPYQDQEVITGGLVVADLERTEPGSFMVLDEDCPLNGRGSRGLYVSLEGSGDVVDIGDEVRLRGTIREIAGETRLMASLSSLEILSVDNPIPEPVNLTEILKPPFTLSYEDWEGQLVAFHRADLWDQISGQKRLQIFPQITLDPSRQLVCFQKESFGLEINGDLLKGGAGPLRTASELEGLRGLIRQGQEGYYLQLIEKPLLVFADEQPLKSQVITEQPVNTLTSSPTATITSSQTSTLTPMPTPSPTGTARPTAIPSPTYFPVRLLISEVLPDPLGEEPGGEWIEIYNPLGTGLLLEGIKIGDACAPGGREGMLRFPERAFIAGGQVLVIANQAGVFQSRYGFLPDFELVGSRAGVPDLVPYHRWGGNTVKLANSGDQVLLVDPWDGIVDLVAYGNGSGCGFSTPVAAPGEGHSLERYPLDGDGDQGGEWRERSTPSPGRLDTSPPTLTATQTGTQGLVVTSSLTGTPSPTITATYPTGSFTTTAISRLTDTPTLSVSLTSSPTAAEPASPTLIPLPSETHSPVPSLVSTSSPTATISETPCGTPSLSPGLTITPTAIMTASPTQEALPTWSATPGSNTVTPSATSLNTAVPTATITPIPTPTAGSGLIVVINEILADPDPVLGDSNRDGVISTDDDEFLEIVNISEETLDLSGWTVVDAVRLRFVIPEGILLKSGCGLVIFGGGVPAGDFGGSLVFRAGSLGLNNTGDQISLLDSDGVVIATVNYGPEGNQNQSLTRNPDLFGSLPLALHSQVPESGGSLFSPGTRSNGTAFGTCP